MPLQPIRVFRTPWYLQMLLPQQSLHLLLSRIPTQFLLFSLRGSSKEVFFTQKKTISQNLSIFTQPFLCFQKGYGAPCATCGFLHYLLSEQSICTSHIVLSLSCVLLCSFSFALDLDFSLARSFSCSLARSFPCSLARSLLLSLSFSLSLSLSLIHTHTHVGCDHINPDAL